MIRLLQFHLVIVGPLLIAAGVGLTPAWCWETSKSQTDEIVALRAKPGDVNAASVRVRYLKTLSPGGRAYFYVNAREAKLALKELSNLPMPMRDSGSALYLKAFCLASVHKFAEAVPFYEQARKKIGGSFRPGNAFYEDYVVALTRTKKYSEALKMVALARKVPVDGRYKGDCGYISIGVDEAALLELSGRYEEAFKAYFALFRDKGTQFGLNIPLLGSQEEQQAAIGWLKKNTSMPNNLTEVQKAAYFVKRGNANLSLGKNDDAITDFKKARTLGDDYLTNKYIGDKVGMRKVREQACANLMRLYYTRKDFAKCCENIRPFFGNEPIEECGLGSYNVCLQDVIEVAAPQDVSAHSIDAESEILSSPQERAEMESKWTHHQKLPTMSKSVLERSDGLAKSRSLASRGDFAGAYNALLRYESVAESNGRGNPQSDEFYLYKSKFGWKIKLQRMACGLASGKADVPLSFASRDGAFLTVPSTIEQCLVERLTPDELKLAWRKKFGRDVGNERLCWSRFAFAVSRMRKQDFKTARQQFDAILAAPPTPDDLQLFTKAMKGFVIARKTSMRSFGDWRKPF